MQTSPHSPFKDTLWLNGKVHGLTKTGPRIWRKMIPVTAQAFATTNKLCLNVGRCNAFCGIKRSGSFCQPPFLKRTRDTPTASSNASSLTPLGPIVTLCQFMQPRRYMMNLSRELLWLGNSEHIKESLTSSGGSLERRKTHGLNHELRNTSKPLSSVGKRCEMRR